EVRCRTRVLASGVLMLARLSGKFPAVYRAQFAGSSLTAALIRSMSKATSSELTGCPSDHLYRGFILIVTVLPPSDQRGGWARLSAGSIVGEAPWSGQYSGRHIR